MLECLPQDDGINADLHIRCRVLLFILLLLSKYVLLKDFASTVVESIDSIRKLGYTGNCFLNSRSISPRTTLPHRTVLVLIIAGSAGIRALHQKQMMRCEEAPHMIIV